MISPRWERLSNKNVCFQHNPSPILSVTTFAIFTLSQQGSATCCPINHTKEILINHNIAQLIKLSVSGLGSAAELPKVASRVSRGHDFMASLILAECQKRTQQNKGEIKALLRGEKPGLPDTLVRRAKSSSQSFSN